MEKKIEFNLKGTLNESSFNQLCETIFEFGGCLEGFPRPFCGVFTNKATCVECISECIKLPQAHVISTVCNVLNCSKDIETGTDYCKRHNEIEP